MNQPTTIDPRFPVGKFTKSASLTPADRQACIAEIAKLPAQISAAVRGLTPEQLDTPYREGGWTVRQVVHHVADSHMNAWVRMRLGVTEDNPPAKAYDERLWAEQADSRTAPPELSLELLDGLHRRWVMWLGSLPAEAFGRTVMHSENGSMTLDVLLQLYAWHSRHHVAHITTLRASRGW